MVRVLDSGSGGPGSSPGRGTALCSWARYFTLIVPLSTQVYKWVPANLLQGGVEILLVASCYGNRDKLRPDGPLGSYADFTNGVIFHPLSSLIFPWHPLSPWIHKTSRVIVFVLAAPRSPFSAASQPNSLNSKETAGLTLTCYICLCLWQTDSCSQTLFLSKFKLCNFNYNSCDSRHLSYIFVGLFM